MSPASLANSWTTAAASANCSALAIRPLRTAESHGFVRATVPPGRSNELAQPERVAADGKALVDDRGEDRIRPGPGSDLRLGHVQCARVVARPPGDDPAQVANRVLPRVGCCVIWAD